MSVCGNCKAKLSCGCQRRKATDGTQVCSNCITNYETKLKANKAKDNLQKFTK
jgi:hypothetical protein